MKKAFVDGEKITLTVKGREMTFSEEELSAILEQYFNREIIEKETKTGINKLIVGKKIMMVPKMINQELFQEERQKTREEWTRQLIVEAFVEGKKNPEKYAKPFITITPQKTCELKTVEELEYLAENVGGHITFWIEKALEWAQIIDNGVSWKSLCGEADTEEWYRLVKWKNGEPVLVGGASKIGHTYFPTNCRTALYPEDYRLRYAVPSITIYI